MPMTRRPASTDLAREGEQPLGERGRPLRAAHRVLHRAGQAVAIERGRLERALQGFQVADDDGQEVVEVVRHAAGELADSLHLLRLGKLLLRPFQRLRHLAPFGHVARDLGETQQVAVLVADRIDDDAGPELRAVLAHAQALGLERALARGGREGARRRAGGAIGVGVEACEMLADDLRCPIALDALGAGIPVGHHAVGVEHVQGVVPHALDEMLEAPLGVFALGRLPDEPRVGRRQLRRPFADLAFQALLAQAQRLFDAPPTLDLVLRGAIELGVGDGRRDLPGDEIEEAGIAAVEQTERVETRDDEAQAARLAARGDRQDDGCGCRHIPGAAGHLVLELLGKACDDARRMALQHLADRPRV
jgi:hypothetical protein